MGGEQRGIAVAAEGETDLEAVEELVGGEDFEGVSEALDLGLGDSRGRGLAENWGKEREDEQIGKEMHTL
jgi:hypothetical protein